MKSAIFGAAALLLLVACPTNADLPVHCLRNQVAGRWTFHLGPLSKERSQCGHRMPDVEEAQPATDSLKIRTSLDVQLNDPSTAMVAGKPGTWTMVYDEGFSVESAQNTFFAFSKYLLSDVNSTSWFASTVHGKKVFRSICGKTEVGWYQDKASGQWGCYFGVKKVQNPDKWTDHLSFLEVSAGGGVQEPWGESEQERIVDEINKAPHRGWTAALYPEFKGKTMEQLNRRAGRPRYSLMQVNSAGQTPQHRHMMKRVQPRSNSFLSKSVKVSKVTTKKEVTTKNTTAMQKSSKLPESWDWRNVDGKNYLEPVLDQQDCGSCYAVSSVHMLTARQRVLKKNPKLEPFSIDFPLYCSDLNQGCKGGYPSLISMWSGQVGLVPQKCVGNYFVNDQMQCKDLLEKKPATGLLQCLKENPPARVKSWGYVGGYYGNCTSMGMMEELVSRGPIAVALEPDVSFMYYKNGIYRHAALRQDTEWTKVDHAVLLVGYGAEKKADGTEDKYWIVQNSWGPSWGEDGYIRIARDENESGIEFQAAYAVMDDKLSGQYTSADSVNSLIESLKK